MNARFCGSCGDERSSSNHKYCKSCGRRFADTSENTIQEISQPNRTRRALAEILVAVAASILGAGLLVLCLLPIIEPTENHTTEQVVSADTTSDQASEELSQTPAPEITDSSPSTRVASTPRFYIAGTVTGDSPPYPPYRPEGSPEGAVSEITNDSFKSYDECEGERMAKDGLGQGRPVANFLTNSLVTQEMRCVSDTNPAWLGVRPEDQWFFFSSSDIDSTTKTVRCLTKDETFSLLLTSEGAPYKTKALCEAAAEYYIDDVIIPGWKENGLDFHKNEWPTSSCAYCVRGDDPMMDRSSR